jgi:DNA-binding MarR family transcriptional regulator
MADPDDLGLVDSVVQLSFAVHGILGAIAAEYDLSITQVRMLGILRDREPGMLELARFLSLEKSSVTGLVDRAEQRGLVARVRDAHDGRGFRVQLTPHGHEAARAFSARVEGEIASLFAGIPTAERTRLSRTASRVIAGRPA